MRLSFNLEYFGDCRDAVSFYGGVFDKSLVALKTYKEMDMAEMLGITGPRLDMIWQSQIDIPCADSVLCLEMSDSLMAAMQKEVGLKQLLYNPVICISHNDENYVRSVFNKLYDERNSFENLQKGDVTDAHGIRWQYQKSDNCGIFYCLTFDGFCSDVIAFYESVFQIKATEVIKYCDCPQCDKIPLVGADKIYSAVLPLGHGNNTYALKLSDSYDSAMVGRNSYDPNALLFYQGLYNPLFTVRDNDVEYLSQAFERLKCGAKLNRPLTPEDNGTVYGSLIDKYGICWNFYCRWISTIQMP